MSKERSGSKTAAGYTKQQYLKSKKYSEYKDIVQALLKDGKTYTVDQVDKMVDDFLKKEAK